MILFHVFLWCEWKLVDSHKIAAAVPAVIQPNDRNNDLSLCVSRETRMSFGYGCGFIFRKFWFIMWKKIERTRSKLACNFAPPPHSSEYKTDSENDKGKRMQNAEFRREVDKNCSLLG